MVHKRILGVVLGGLCAVQLAGAAGAAQDRVSGIEKGSVLIFSKVDISWDVADGAVVQDTFIELTNDYPQGVFVQMYFINGDPPCGAYGICPDREIDCDGPEPGWNWVDNKIYLTPDEPCYWSVSTGYPKGVSAWNVLDPDGREADGGALRQMRGYIIAFACDAAGNEIRHNHLAGKATLVTYAGGLAWSYNAWAFQVVAEGVGHGELLPDSGQLDFDGSEYAQAYDLLLVLFQAEGAASFSGSQTILSFTDLTLHPVSADLRQETEGPVTTKAHVDIWNENEIKFSGAYHCITCWDQVSLADWGQPNHWDIYYLQTNFGKARIDGLRSQRCDVNCDPFDGLALGQGYGDVVSEDAALLGLWRQVLEFDGGLETAVCGGNLFGMGVEDAQILFDKQAPPPENPTEEITSTLDGWTSRPDRSATSADQKLQR